MGDSVVVKNLFFILLSYSLLGCSFNTSRLSESAALKQMIDDQGATQKVGSSDEKYALAFGYPENEIIDIYGLNRLKGADRLEFYGVYIASHIRAEEQIPDGVKSLQMSDMHVDRLDFDWILKARNIQEIDFSFAKIDGESLDYFLLRTPSSHISLQNADCDLLFRVSTIVKNTNIRYLDLRSFAGANDQRVEELREKRPDIDVIWNEKSTSSNEK